MAWWQNFWHTLTNQMALLRITDAIDIALVSFIVYQALKFIRETKTIQLLKGIVLIVVITQLSFFLKLNTIHYILSNFLQLGVIALLVVFQPEIRRALEHVGRKTGENIFASHNEFGADALKVLREVSKAAQDMSNSKTGALIVIENKDNIDSLISSGVQISAEVSSQLLENIFVPDTPLHDGATIIRDYKVALSSCVLPLTKNPDISTSYGTRHRAAIGISEESDAVSVIVSEETGKISIAYKGELTTNYTEDTLRRKLIDLISINGVEADQKSKFKISGRSKRRQD